MRFSKVESIKEVESKPIYHLSVEKNRNFFGNNICLHNCDYYKNKVNDGHIMFAFYNFGEFPINIIKGEAIGQGYFTPFLKVDDDVGNNIERQGGFNSTGN